MTYLAELDDGPREVRLRYPGNVLHFWPKVAGTGNVQLAFEPVYRLLAPDGTQLSAGAWLNATNTDLGDVGEEVTRVDLAVDTQDTDRWPLGKGYRAEIVWDAPGEQRYETLHFSVARQPYRPGISLNDFSDELADAPQILEGQAQALDAAHTAEQRAAVLAVKAWTDVYRWLETRLRNEGDRIVPRLVMPPWKLDHVVIAQALHRMFRAEGGGADSDAALLAQNWAEEATNRFGALGVLEYDEDEDGIPDVELSGPTTHRVRRSWD